MQEILKINGKTFYDTDTTVLFTSEFNTTSDAIEFLHNSCTVINQSSNVDKKDITNNLYEDFNCEELKNKTILTKLDKIKLSILANLESEEKIFVFMNVLTYLDKDFKRKVINYLKEHQKLIINYTSEIEETLYLDYLIVIHDNKIVMEGTKEQILSEEKILKKLGFKLPSILELSNGLKYYGLIDKSYYDNESLVDVLWK